MRQGQLSAGCGLAAHRQVLRGTRRTFDIGARGWRLMTMQRGRWNPLVSRGQRRVSIQGSFTGTSPPWSPAAIARNAGSLRHRR